MTTSCDKKGCNKNDGYISNMRMFKLKLDGSVEYPRTESCVDKPISKHLCYTHRNELAKIIEDYLGK